MGGVGQNRVDRLRSRGGGSGYTPMGERGESETVGQTRECAYGWSQGDPRLYGTVRPGETPTRRKGVTLTGPVRRGGVPSHESTGPPCRLPRPR